MFLFPTDLCTEPEKRSIRWKSWIDEPQPSPEGQPVLGRKKHTRDKHKIFASTAIIKFAFKILMTYSNTSTPSLRLFIERE